MQLKYHLFKISFDISLHTSSEGYSEAVEMIKNKTKIEEVSFINNHFKPLKNLVFQFNDNDTHSHLQLQVFFKKKL